MKSNDKHGETQAEMPEEQPAVSGEKTVDEPQAADIASTEDSSEAGVSKPSVPAKRNIFSRAWTAVWVHKRWSLPVIIAGLIGVLLLIPLTRYQLLGLFMQKNFAVVVMDDKTKQPVSSANVIIGNTKVQTDNKGRATIRARVGTRTVSVEKKYYKINAFSVLIPLHQKNAPFVIGLLATGRQVPVKVVNKITGLPLQNATVSAAGTEIKTDKDGKAVMVLPADKSTVSAKVTLGGYNDLAATVTVTEQSVPQNTFNLVTSGKIYFLSNQSGTIDVVKTNLDGSDRQTVLAGTGKESPSDTVLLVSRDWKFLALQSRRDGGDNAKLFLINTANDKLTTMDEGNAYFTMTGWSGHRFIYVVNRQGVENWQPKAQALKSYDADSNKITVLDETQGEGTGPSDFAYTRFNNFYILDNELVYTNDWYGGYWGTRLNGKQVSVMSVKPDGSAKHSIKDVAVNKTGWYGFVYYGLNVHPYEPQGLYVAVPGQNANDPTAYFAYEDGKLTARPDMSNDEFNKGYQTYLVSPSGKQVFWSENRDGKNVMFIGDQNAQNSKQVASLSEYYPYGWYTDDYLLVSKNGSELYIMPVTGGQPLKVTDYQRPRYGFIGNGWGYGGL